MSDSYALRHVEQRLAEDDATAELGVHLFRTGGRVFVRGQVSGEPRRGRVLAIVREMCPDDEVMDELSCAERTLAVQPDHTEVIR